MFVLRWFIFCTYTMLMMCSFTALYHAWLTLRGRVAYPYSASGLHHSIVASHYHIYMYFVLSCAPVFVCDQVLVIIHVYAVTNACTRIVYFLHIYHACDVLFLLLYTMRGRPFVVVSLRALYLAPGPFSFRAFYLASGPFQPLGFFHSTVV